MGGTAAAIHAGHRIGVDGDHMDLILGQLDGILTGIRQLQAHARLKPRG